MKILFLFSLLTSFLLADYVKGETLACPSISTLKNAEYETEGDFVKVNLYAIKNNCYILNRSDSIQAIGFDVASEQNLIIKIKYNKTSQILYIQRKAVQIEQPGNKNIIRF